MSVATFPYAGPPVGPKMRDYDVVRRRTRITMTISICAHLLLMMWLTMIKPALQQTPELTEITLIDPGDLAAPAAAAAPSAGPEVKGMPQPSAREQRFQRARTDADIEPEPQSTAAAADRIAARLASIQNHDAARVEGIANASLPTGVLGSGAVSGGTLGGGAGPISLTRGGGSTGTGPALALTRGGSGTGPSAAVVATGLPSSASEASAPARSEGGAARRSLAGASLMGPVADRPVLSYTRPVYPEWAKRDAVEGSVTLYFVVRPDGSIKENVLVQKTAGFEDFDENARTALRAWRFQPLTGGRTGEQWGTITFHFRLSEPG
jgi:TonB family protein